MPSSGSSLVIHCLSRIDDSQGSSQSWLSFTKQCLSVIATNAAAITTLNRGATDPRSLQQIYNNHGFFSMVSMSGFMLVSFTPFLLHLVKMASFYLLILSCASMFICFGTLSLNTGLAISQMDLKALHKTITSEGPSECGGTQPWLWCSQAEDFPSDFVWSDDTFSQRSLFAFCSVFMAWIILTRLIQLVAIRKIQILLCLCKQTYIEMSSNMPSGLKSFRRSNADESVADLAPQVLIMAVKRHLRRLNDRVPMLWNRISNDCEECAGMHMGTPLKSIQALCFILVRLTFSSVYIFYMKDLVSSLAWFAQSDLYNSDWNFGQVVALTLWAPSILGWFHLEFRGMRRGMNHRLLPPYQVTKAEESLKENDFDDL